MKLYELPLRILLTVTAIWAGSLHSEPVKLPATSQVFSVEELKKNCINFPGIKIGRDPGDISECRVSEFGTLGKYKNNTYYYTMYCMMPAENNQADKCDSNSWIAQYHHSRGMAVFFDNGLTGKLTLLM